MEGSKAGAGGATVWTARRWVPLDVDGYGKIIGGSMEGAYPLTEDMRKLESFMAGEMGCGIHDICSLSCKIK